MRVLRPKKVWDFTRYIPDFNENKIKIGDIIRTKDSFGKINNFDVDGIEFDNNEGICFTRESRFYWGSSRLIGFNEDNKHNYVLDSRDKKSIK
jgi:hypothetical protein